jgi:cation:H+ antiporter
MNINKLILFYGSIFDCKIRTFVGMESVIFWIAVFILSLVVLIFSANKFIEAAEKIGLSLNINPFIIGVTIVAVGTSLPELITSILAVLKNSSEIVLGNVVGSNITNISLVLGLVAIIMRRVDIEFDMMKVEIPILLFSALLAWIMMLDGFIDFLDGIVCLMGLSLFIIYTIRNKSEDIIPEGAVIVEKKAFPVSSLILFIISGVAIYFSADYNVTSIIKISEFFNISKEVVSVTVVSLGTSLPEVVVSIAAARSKRFDLAVGNIIGSNIFNTFAVLGIPALIGPLVISTQMMSLSLPIMLSLTFLLYIFLLSKKINRWQGWIFILMYAFFILSNVRSVL